MLSHFAKCAGLKLNKGKSEVIRLGNCVEKSKTVCGMQIVNKPIKTLGVWISNDSGEIPELNFKERISKLKNLLNMWKQRALTLKGKITIINSLALSQIMYICNVLYVSPDIIKEVNDLIFSFLWPKKVHVKKSTIIGLIEEGGLKMPDFEIKILACKAMWVKRLLLNNKCAVLAESFGLPLQFKEMCKLNVDMKFLDTYHSTFYRQVLDSWYSLQDIPCKKGSDVMKQFLWFNKNIVVDCKPIFIEAMYKKSIKYINDLLSEEGQFLQLNTLNDTFGTNLTVMQYNSIKSAIPKEWKRLLRSVNNRLKIEDNENKNISILQSTRFPNVCLTFLTKTFTGNLLGELFRNQRQ